jgi:hypothetical protein
MSRAAAPLRTITAEGDRPRPNPEDFAGRPISSLRQACPLSGAPEALTWWCEAFLLRGAAARKRVGVAIIDARPQPVDLTLSFSRAVERVAARGLVIQKGAARAITSLVAQCRLENEVSAPHLSEQFLKLPFRMEDLRLLLACLVAPAPARLAANTTAEQAWVQADHSLASAFQHVQELRKAARLSEGLPKDIRIAVGEAAVFLAAAADNRGMSLIGESGQIVMFDQELHAQDHPGVGLGQQIRVRRPAVRRGAGTNARTILKADVEPI